MVNQMYTIAVIGNYNPLSYSLHQLEFARVVGSHIARLGAIVAIDTQPGFSSWSALGATEVGGVSIGFSPASSRYEHENQYRLPLDNFSTVIYTGFGYLGRDLVLVRSVDCVVVFLDNEKLGHDAKLAKELQKPLLVISFEKTEDEIKDLLGGLYDYAEIYSNQKEVLNRIEKLVSSHNHK